MEQRRLLAYYSDLATTVGARSARGRLTRAKSPGEPVFLMLFAHLKISMEKQYVKRTAFEPQFCSVWPIIQSNQQPLFRAG